MVNMRPETNFIKSQRILCFILMVWMYSKKRRNDPLKAVFEQKSQGKRARSRPRKLRVDEVAEDLRAMGIEN